MIQPVQDTYRFYLAPAQYKRIGALGWLFVIALLLIASGTIAFGIWWWGTYAHAFTPYLKWQDALLSLTLFSAFIALGGIMLAGRFLYALRKGYTQGMLTLVSNSIHVRDLSPENFKSIFWVMKSAFWCFIVVLIGLSPSILPSWTLHLSSALLIISATGIVVLLGLGGLGISIVAFVLIIIGCIGCISFCNKLGLSYTYELNGRTSLSIDNFVLTIIQPDRPESMIDLHLLSAEDQSCLLGLLHQRWIDAERKWSPGFGEELAQALEGVSM